MSRPLVSVITFCRNGERTIRRCVETVLNQTYDNIQYVVQDGASTDGTLAILSQYQGKLDLVSAPDGGTNDAFWRALQRCRGDYIATCLADEQMQPTAIERAIQEFEADPSIGSVTGDAYLCQEDGIVFGTHVGQEFDLLSYLLGDYCPNFSASFFRRQALIDIGFFEDRWKDGVLDTVEFELWCRLGIEHKVKYVPYIFSKYGMGEDQQSHKIQRILGELDSRFMIIDRHLFGAENFFGAAEETRRFIIHRQLEIIINHLSWNGRPAEANMVRRRMRAILGYTVSEEEEVGGQPEPAAAPAVEAAPAPPLPREVPVAAPPPPVPAFVPAPPPPPAFATASSIAIRAWRQFVPAPVRRAIPQRYKNRVRSAVRSFRAGGYMPNVKPAVPPTAMAIGMPAPAPAPVPPPAPTPAPPPVVPAPAPAANPELIRAPMYNRVAERYRMRGQIEQAWQMWQHTNILRDEQIASTAWQVLLKMPHLSEGEHAALQRKWSETYAQPIVSKTRIPYPFRLRQPGEKLTIAYHCVYLGAEGSKSEVLPFIKNHDRKRFRVLGYSPYEEPAYVRKVFDKFQTTGNLDHAAFVDAVRAEGVDIFIELSGLSYRHRFPAMASRCAPVQVHYMNHAGPICIPNMDYILADSVSAPPQCDINYSEKIYRLPGSLFGFDRDESTIPAITPPPHLKNGYVTFGFFGGSEKLNADNLRLWADMLKAIPTARLMIQGPTDQSHRTFIEHQFRSFGVDPRRLTLLPRCDWKKLIENYALVDISLDTWPYCGANTIADSVYQGVPVITLCGDKFASAYGAAQVIACGLPELVARSHDEFVSIAATLSADSAKLIRLRKELRRMVREHGFGDSVAMARKLEAAYLEMYAEARSQLRSPPA